MSRILLIGGHGKVALLLEPLLVAAGHHVTAVVRNPAHEADVAATGATPLVADIERFDLDQLTSLESGNDVVIWSAGAGGGSAERTYAVDRDAAIRSIDAAVAARVPRYLMVSYFGAGPDHGVDPADSFFAYAEAKAAADAHPRGPPVEIGLRRGHLLLHLLGFGEHGVHVHAAHAPPAKGFSLCHMLVLLYDLDIVRAENIGDIRPFAGRRRLVRRDDSDGERPAR